MNNAKYAFYYLFSLVALIFVAISTGIVVFQIINQTVVDSLANYADRANQEALRFAIASLVFATPIFYWMSKLIKDGLVKGDLEQGSGIRRWLTYFIIFVASVVMLVWLIMTLNSFLNGELTLKFALKTLTVMVIAGAIFSYYLYDAKKALIEATDKVRLAFFVASLILVLGVFVASWFFVDSPAKVRLERYDREVANRLSQIESAVNQFYNINKRLPADFAELLATNGIYLEADSTKNPESKTDFEYRIIDAQTFELCADFKSATDDNRDKYYDLTWRHQAGKSCFKKVIFDAKAEPKPVLID